MPLLIKTHAENYLSPSNYSGLTFNQVKMNNHALKSSVRSPECKIRPAWNQGREMIHHVRSLNLPAPCRFSTSAPAVSAVQTQWGLATQKSFSAWQSAYTHARTHTKSAKPTQIIDYTSKNFIDKHTRHTFSSQLDKRSPLHSPLPCKGHYVSPAYNMTKINTEVNSKWLCHILKRE